jgi:hypothetical protein
MDHSLTQGTQHIAGLFAAFGWEDGTENHPTSFDWVMWYILAKKSWVPARA